jgi:hypothetical protein
VPCALGRFAVDHAELKPDAFGTDRDRLVDMGTGRLGTPEDVDDLDLKLSRDV